MKSEANVSIGKEALTRISRVEMRCRTIAVVADGFPNALDNATVQFGNREGAFREPVRSCTAALQERLVRPGDPKTPLSTGQPIPGGGV